MSKNTHDSYRIIIYIPAIAFPMHQIQLLLPLSDNDGTPFPVAHYGRVREELTERFQGLTAYSRAPAEGLWKKDDHAVARDIRVQDIRLL